MEEVGVMYMAQEYKEGMGCTGGRKYAHFFKA